VATRKSNSPAGLPARLAAAVAYLWGPGRTATAIVLLLAGFAAGSYAVWRHVEKKERARYILTLDQLQVTPLPPWIHSDVRAEGFRNASRDSRLSALDDDLVSRIADAFALHPWVAKVNRVTKHPPARVDVDLVYRQPVSMVEVAGGDLLPVDAEGVLLPGMDFTPTEKRSYPFLAGIETLPMRPVGQPWGDGRVLDGALIAAAFGPAWQQLKLYRIQPSAGPAAATPRETAYELSTWGGTRIVWGLGPTTKLLGEPSAAEKVARLQQYAATHGGLDGRAGAQLLDVRTLPAAKKP
jgi:hypothetical protein